MPVICFGTTKKDIAWDVRSGLLQSFTNGDSPSQLTKDGNLLVSGDRTSFLFRTDKEERVWTIDGRCSILSDGRLTVLSSSHLTIHRALLVDGKEVAHNLLSIPIEVLDGVLLLHQQHGTFLYTSEAYIPVPDHGVVPASSRGRYFLLRGGAHLLLVDRNGICRVLEAQRDAIFQFLPRLGEEPDLLFEGRGSVAYLWNVSLQEPKIVATLELDAGSFVMERDRLGNILIREKGMIRRVQISKGAGCDKLALDSTSISVPGLLSWTGEGFANYVRACGRIYLTDEEHALLEKSPVIEETIWLPGPVIIPKREGELVKRMARQLFSGLLVRDLSTLVGAYV